MAWSGDSMTTPPRSKMTAWITRRGRIACGECIRLSFGDATENRARTHARVDGALWEDGDDGRPAPGAPAGLASRRRGTTSGRRRRAPAGHAPAHRRDLLLATRARAG